MKVYSEKYLKYFVILYSLIPFSLILGNAIININVILINFVFIYIIIKNNDYSSFRQKDFFYLIIIWLYLIINSIIQYKNHENNNQYIFLDDGFQRSLGFIRYILFYLATKKFSEQFYKSWKIVFYIWTAVISIVILDIFFERVFGFNITGNASSSTHRISSFFGTELVAGGFLYGLAFISLAFVLTEKFFNKYFSIFILFAIPISIFITGERSNFIKSLVIFFLFLLFIDEKKLYIKKFNITAAIIILIALTFFSRDIRERQLIIINEIKSSTSKHSDKFYLNTRNYYNNALGIKIFLDNKFFGVGMKKFREICKSTKYKKISQKGCTTHPHQIYIELLSELGMIGFLLITIPTIVFLIKGINIYSKSRDLILLSCLLFIGTTWIPFLPSGSFFSSFNFSFYIINFGIASSFINNYSLKINENNCKSCS